MKIHGNLFAKTLAEADPEPGVNVIYENGVFNPMYVPYGLTDFTTALFVAHNSAYSAMLDKVWNEDYLDSIQSAYSYPRIFSIGGTSASAYYEQYGRIFRPQTHSSGEDAYNDTGASLFIPVRIPDANAKIGINYLQGGTNPYGSGNYYLYLQSCIDSSTGLGGADFVYAFSSNVGNVDLVTGGYYTGEKYYRYIQIEDPGMSWQLIINKIWFE